MSMTIDAISNQALILPPAQRLSLACALIESVESDDAPSPDAAWDAEIRDRIARFDRGETTGIPASDVFRKLREIAPVT
jgi:putative addiction module component (TIGR02574 family)